MATKPCLICGKPVEQPSGKSPPRNFDTTECRDLYRMIHGLRKHSELDRRYEAVLSVHPNEVYKEKARRTVRRLLRQFIADTKVSEGAS